MDDNLEMVFDPNYQNNLFLIESAMRSVGALDNPQPALPDVFDNQLRELIDAVPLE